MKTLRIPQENHETIENLRIPREIQEIHANLIIYCKNNTTHENH